MNKKQWWKTQTGAAFLFLVSIIAVLGILGMTLLRPAASSPADVVTTGSMQEIRMAATRSGYSPQTLTVTAGQNVRWIIDGTNAQGCVRFLSAPTIGVSKQLAPGQNVIEFVAPSSGTIPFSCSMGMYRGVINVIPAV